MDRFLALSQEYVPYSFLGPIRAPHTFIMILAVSMTKESLKQINFMKTNSEETKYQQSFKVIKLTFVFIGVLWLSLF